MYVVISLDTKSLRVFSKMPASFQSFLSLLYFHEAIKNQAQKYTVTGTYQNYLPTFIMICKKLIQSHGIVCGICNTVNISMYLPK